MWQRSSFVSKSKINERWESTRAIREVGIKSFLNRSLDSNGVDGANHDDTIPTSSSSSNASSKTCFLRLSI